MTPLPPVGGANRFDTDLAVGMRHLAEANMSLLRQRRLLWRIEARGEPTKDAEDLFSDMIQTLQIMRERLAILEVAGDVSASPLAPAYSRAAVAPPALTAGAMPGKTAASRR